MLADARSRHIQEVNWMIEIHIRDHIVVVIVVVEERLPRISDFLIMNLEISGIVRDSEGYPPGHIHM